MTKRIKTDLFEVMRALGKSNESSQRNLAKYLDFSLGKINYCLKELKKKGYIKIKNFKKSPNKLNYMYFLTPKGISQKTKITLSFMKKKMEEYDDLEKEYRKLIQKKTKN